MNTTLHPRAGCRASVRGVVQGVGFRPFVHRLAIRYQVDGWVRNGSGEVALGLEGEEDALHAFLAALRQEAPPLARIESVTVDWTEPTGLSGFVIEVSDEQPGARLPVPPEIAICPACEAELLDPMNRRYRYPFITCTDCGPRYSIIQRLPYDRERTTMRAFEPCPACALEYQTPGNRRHHSETNSCAACGPTLWYESHGAAAPDAVAAGALREAARLLTGGGILALRGFGGFHLAADATSPEAVALLRRRKGREAKPFAVMVRSVEEARRFAALSAAEAELLTSPERPIVLLQARADAPLAPAVAPGVGTIGVMLPSTPIHLLLAERVYRPLVMTSGNRSDEPIAIGNQEARRRLAVIADGFLLHDREILSRVDDSVLRVVQGAPVYLRRSRGYAPLPVPLPVAAPVPLLAVGPHLKNTFTLAIGDQAWVSPHIGDLEDLEGLEHFRQTLAVYRRLFALEPEAVAYDLHPGYLSTRIAQELTLPTMVGVQHHHAHIAAVLAEHGEEGPAIGVAFDGTGYGSDGAVWGGEILHADLRGFQRLAHLRYAPLPGGDLAARRPWRALLGLASLDGSLRRVAERALAEVPEAELALVERQLASRLNSPLTSSIGRLFDAAAALLGLRTAAAYEGQAAMELEHLAGSRTAAEYPMPLEEGDDGGFILDPVPLLVRLGARRQRGADPADLAADFHASLARGTELAVRRAAELAGCATVVLAGGVFQNARLLASLRTRLELARFRVLTASALPPNDGGVSYGQAAVAAARLARPLTS